MYLLHHFLNSWYQTENYYLPFSIPSSSFCGINRTKLTHSKCVNIFLLFLSLLSPSLSLCSFYFKLFKYFFLIPPLLLHIILISIQLRRMLNNFHFLILTNTKLSMNFILVNFPHFHHLICCYHIYTWYISFIKS